MVNKMNFAQIFTFENLFRAHELCRRGKQHKRGTIMFEMDNAKNIVELARTLQAGKYRISKYREFNIYDPKPRIIRALPYKDRVVQMCFCKNSIEPRLESRLIHDNAASRCGRGTDFALGRLTRFMNKIFINHGYENAYFLKCDIRKYFPSIDHDILLAQLRRCGFSADEMSFMEMVIRSHNDSRGLPLGNQTSQWFALLYLNDADRFIKEQLRVPYYVRYMDDFILVHWDIDFLRRCRVEIGRFCAEKLNLQLNSKTQIGRLRDGVDFLGFNHKLTPTGAVRRRMRASARRRQNRYLKTISKYYLQNVVDDDFLSARLASFKGHLRDATDKKYIVNRINSLRARKRRIMARNNLKNGQI